MHGGQQLGGSGTKVDAGHPKFFDHAQGSGGVFLHVSAVVSFAQRASPGVEELHGGCARLDLSPQKLPSGARGPLHQLAPGNGVGMHHGAGA